MIAGHEAVVERRRPVQRLALGRREAAALDGGRRPSEVLGAHVDQLQTGLVAQGGGSRMERMALAGRAGERGGEDDQVTELGTVGLEVAAQRAHVAGEAQVVVAVHRVAIRGRLAVHQRDQTLVGAPPQDRVGKPLAAFGFAVAHAAEAQPVGQQPKGHPLEDGVGREVATG